jgi:hypothetical protein
MTMLPAGTLSKVPEVTLGFWVIKVLATTLGGTTAVIPNKTNRRKPFPYNKRPVTATRSSACSVASKTHAASLPDTTKCARNFLSAVCLIAAIYFWLN